MKKYFRIIKNYVEDHKKQFIRGGIVVLGIAVVIFILALVSYNTPRTPKIVYEPANACDLLTLDEAKSFLGDATINGVATTPVQSGNITDSQCSYSDGKVDTAHAVVIALIVRSGINDQGIAANKAAFTNGEPTTGVQTVNNVGDSAYFNETNGQLNILKESTWIVLTYGPGADPASSTLDDDIKVAQKVLNSQ